MTHPNSSQLQAEYQQILNTWRFQDEVTKRTMIGELSAMESGDLDKSLAMDILKLIDAIQIELRLEDVQESE
jgi:hypothetical protein